MSGHTRVCYLCVGEKLPWITTVCGFVVCGLAYIQGWVLDGKSEVRCGVCLVDLSVLVFVSLVCAIVPLIHEPPRERVLCLLLLLHMYECIGRRIYVRAIFMI